MKNKSRSKIVILESITIILYPVLLLYLIRGFKIYYFQIDRRTKKRKWFQKKLKQNRLEQIIWEDYSYILHFRSNEKAFEKNEEIYTERFRNSKMINEGQKLLKSNLIHGVYKKVLLENLQYAFDLQSMLNDFINKSKYKKSIFFPITCFEIISKKDWDVDSKIKIAPLSYLIFYITTAIKKIKYFVLIMLMSMWIIIHIEKIFPNKIDQKKYQLGIRIYANDWGISEQLRSIDFLLDGKTINENNTLFCIETDISKEYLQKLKEKNYNIVRIPKILSHVDKNFMKETLNLGYIYRCFKIAILSCLEPSFLARPSLICLYEYLLWKRFLDKYCIKHFVVYNDFAIDHVVRNILLNQNGTQTWYYEHSCHFGDAFAPPNENVSFLEIEWSFLYYDYLVSWGNESTRIFSMHPSSIKQYLNLGTLWSEHVRMISEREVQSNVLKDMKRKMKRLPTKIISVFDTTFGKGVDAPLQSNDMVLFIEGILKILDDYPEIGVIFKEKKRWEEVLEQNPKKEVKTVYEKLKTHERCCAPGSRSETAEAIAASDLVISACFTSTVIEALGARKKAIYFDASDKLRDYYYDKFPKLVAHGYNELKKLVQYWLYDITDEEFDEYLETYVKGELDAYVDGRAITRFRELLSQ